MNFYKEINAQPYLSGLVKRGQFVLYLSLLDKLIYFIIFIFLARSFSPGEYGFFISIFAFGNIVVTFSELGFANYFQRKIASDLENLSEEFNSVFTFRLITYVAIISIASVYFYSEPSNLVLVSIVISAIFIFNSSWIVIKLFFGLNQYHSVFNRFLISRGILIISVTILLILNTSLTLLSITFLLSAISEFVLLFKKLIQERSLNFKIAFKTEVLKRIFVSSVPMGMSGFFVMLYDRVDVLLIQKIISIEAVSFYAIAYSLYKIPHLFVPFFLTPLFTDLSSEYESHRKINRLKLKNLFFLFVFFSLISIIVFYFLSDVLISLTYGNKYISSSNLLIILVLALPFLFLNNLTGVILNSIKKEKLTFATTAFGSIINILMNIILLNLIGIEGAVIATILTELFVFSLQANYLFKYRAVMIK